MCVHECLCVSVCLCEWHNSKQLCNLATYSFYFMSALIYFPTFICFAPRSTCLCCVLFTPAFFLPVLWLVSSHLY